MQVADVVIIVVVALYSVMIAVVIVYNIIAVFNP